MLREVAMAGMTRQSEQMFTALAPLPEGSRARIIALGRVYINFATTEPGVFRLMFTWPGDTDDDAELHSLGDSKYEFVQMEVAKCRGSDTIEDQDIEKALLAVELRARAVISDNRRGPGPMINYPLISKHCST
ncbi:TetR-like C-terminal domain-containing protein [Sulfitobacter sp. S190]|uniref:TetR-like C-terminal domain-containing protein n=1 Tax=Sulfitobacter sp. S190 TaxID=2867022 RepID=UPI0021A44988|nr:TetR-like C-terminal domain-containing protein [Sulfitobacter sp. S190]